MARQTINITNGKGSIELVNGTYNATAGDGGHTFDDGVKSIIMTLENKTVEITNPQVPLRNFT